MISNWSPYQRWVKEETIIIIINYLHSELSHYSKSGKLVKYLKDSWRLQKRCWIRIEDLGVMETVIDLIHMLTCYILLQISKLIPMAICNVNSGEWLSCYPERDFGLERNLRD